VPGPVSGKLAVRMFGKPARSYRYQEYTILVWDENLLSKMTGLTRVRSDNPEAISCSSVIEKVLPVGVAWAEEFGDRADAVLFPDEAAAVARAVDRRRREFATARSLAREAMAGLGVAPVSVPPGERGAPRWPPGVVGSITHCAGYRAATVARAGQVRAIGIDAEPDAPLPDGVLDRVSLPGERAMLRGLAVPGPRWDLLLFSAKESVYKAWFPLTGRWLGFEDAELTIHPTTGDAAAGTFAARILVADLSATDGAASGARAPGDPVPGVLGGRWLVSDGILLTAVTVPPGARPAAGMPTPPG
jgi:4'-phosphopantetheinyl transferase EntD